MGLTQSKEQLLFLQINHKNIEGIKSLHRNGASLEHVDKEGRTPLIYACMNSDLCTVAKTLIELGANVNANRPGRHGGTPLHHAAKRGLAPTVELLLSHKANALLVNDDCQTPLEVARAKGFDKVVRMIESHICLFSGWLRELYGPSILERLAPQLLSRKVWAVVVPCGSRDQQKPFKLELVIYSGLQDAKPRLTIPLWKASMADPSFGQYEYTVLVSEPSSKTRIKLSPLKATDKEQLLQFCNACKGIPQVAHTAYPFNASTTFAPVTVSPPLQTPYPFNPPLILAPMAAPPPPPPIHTAAYPFNPPPILAPVTVPPPIHTAYPFNPPPTLAHKSVAASEDAELTMAINASLQSAIQEGIHVNNNPSSSSSSEFHPPVSAPFEPSAPPIDDKVNYPSHETEGGSSTCVVCLDAAVEGVCVPCGHMAGCLSCLNEVKAKKWGCPICRANIDQVVRVYTV